MPKRAIVIAKTHGFVKAPDGQLLNSQKDVMKVMELDATIEDLLEYAQEKQVDGLSVLFETEDPDIRRPRPVPDPKAQ